MSHKFAVILIKVIYIQSSLICHLPQLHQSHKSKCKPFFVSFFFVRLFVCLMVIMGRRQQEYWKVFYLVKSINMIHFRKYSFDFESFSGEMWFWIESKDLCLIWSQVILFQNRLVFFFTVRSKAGFGSDSCCVQAGTCLVSILCSFHSHNSLWILATSNTHFSLSLSLPSSFCHVLSLPLRQRSTMCFCHFISHFDVFLPDFCVAWTLHLIFIVLLYLYFCLFITQFL